MYDGVHFPSPSPALTQHVTTFVLRYLMGCRCIHVNGYPFARDYGVPMPSDELMAKGPKNVWTNEYLPLVKEASARMQARDYDALSATALVESIDTFVAEMCDAFRYTIEVMLGFIMPTVDLVQFCEQELGPEGPTLAATLLQGFKNETSQAAVDLGDLAEAAAGSPEVATCLLGGRFDDIAAAEGGPAFLERFNRFMESYGGRAESWPQLELPTWNEEPEKPLSLIARYVAEPETSPKRAIERAASQRQAAEREIQTRLTPKQRTRFDELFEAARGHVAISEERARWQLIICANLRLPLLALGRKLVKAGAIVEPNDVFFLTFEEASEAARTSEVSYRDRVEVEKALLEHNQRLQPPPFIGAPPDFSQLPPGLQAFMTYFLGAGMPSVKENVITGKGASSGQVRGRARVIRQLKDGAELEKGDILVCQTTSPPWTPLFAIAAAVVTDTGGILSHSAICAREYGIPCVVATQVATAVIPDGATISVDGTTGKVVIEAR